MTRFFVSTVVAALGGGALVAAVGTDARPWKPAGISSPKFESHPAFDPRTGDLYFVRSSPGFSWTGYASTVPMPAAGALRHLHRRPASSTFDRSHVLRA